MSDIDWRDIERIEQCAKWEEKLAAAIAEIDRLREERRWIPVAERLPSVGGEDVFVAHGEWEDGSRSLNMGWWNGREWMFYRSKCGMPPVTHWMPLPAPPKGGEVE